MSAPPHAGWFGKMPALGDFASRRVEAAWAQQLDRWLSAGLAQLQASRGPPWLVGYLSAPVWRFAWAPGVMGPSWWFGVLMPSCDNAGRYFPLWVGQQRPAAPVDRCALDHLELWWSHLAQAALSTLGDGASVDTFERALLDAPPWPAAAVGSPVQADPGGRSGHFQVADGTPFEQLARHLAAQALLYRLDQGSFWWPLLAPGSAGRCRVLTGLPDAADLACMLHGTA